MINGLKKVLLNIETSTSGKAIIIIIESPIKITPPNLSGIVRKIA